MRKLSLKQHKIKVRSRFLQALDSGDLKGIETNSNWVEFWYWFKFNNLKVTVDGVEYGLHNLGKLSKILDSGETNRTVWSKLRSERKLKLDEDARQQFKEEFGIDKPDGSS